VDFLQDLSKAAGKLVTVAVETEESIVIALTSLRNLSDHQSHVSPKLMFLVVIVVVVVVRQRPFNCRRILRLHDLTSVASNFHKKFQDHH